MCGRVSRGLDITRVILGKWVKEEKGKQVHDSQWVQWSMVSKLCIKEVRTYRRDS